MKVIIGCLNSKYIHMSGAPWCLAAGIDAFAKSDIDYEIMESTINGDADDFARQIIAAAPKVLSFSCYIWNITQTLYICEKVKSQTNCIIALGGPEVAYRAEHVLQNYPFVDYVLSGEGEFCYPAFLDALNGIGEKGEVAGLSYRQDGQIVSVPEGCFCQTPPSPFSEQYFKALGGRICYIESSRGCPYRCAFCLSGRVSKLRFFDLEMTKRDLLRLAQSGTQTIKFVDRTFNANEAHANEILNFIKENYGTTIPGGICFHFEIAGDILKESTLEILSLMPKGAVQLEIGMQSFNEATLSAINRKTDTQKLIKNIKRLLDFQNMHIHIDLIAGLTGEDMESFENSFNIGYGLGAHMLQMGFLKLLYGADMRENQQQYPCSFSPDPPYEVTQTPWLSKAEIIALKKCEDALDRLYNSGRFLFTLEYLISDIGYTPFRLFYDFGNAVNGQKMSLGQYAQAVYEYFKDRCDSEILREKLVCDLLCCSAALQIPPSLKIMHPLHKRAKKAIAHGKNIKIAICEKSGIIFAADYQSGRDFFGRFRYTLYNLDGSIKE